MTTFMFWNICRNDRKIEIAAACREYNVDILMLAESEISPRDLLYELNSNGESGYFVPSGVSQRIAFYCRVPVQSFHSVFDDGRSAIRSLKLPVGPEILVVATHLNSKLHAGEPDQWLQVRQLAAAIREMETKAGHSRTLVIGDLNMNPFEGPMVAADGFHAIMDKDIARVGSRVVQATRWTYFYNPMWSRLGDGSSGPPGTFYYRSGGNLNFFWNIFDQILIRPSLLDFFVDEDLKVLTSIGQVKLLRNNRIDTTYSDHLPLIVRLSLDRSFENG